MTSLISGACHSAIFWNRRPDLRPVASMAVVYPLPTAELLSIENPVATQSVAAPHLFGNVIAAILPTRRRLARALSDIPNPVSSARAIFVRGQRTILNFCRPHMAAGKPSFLRALVHDANQTASCIFHRLFLAPVLSSVPVFHAHKKAWRGQHGVQRKSASGA